MMKDITVIMLLTSMQDVPLVALFYGYAQLTGIELHDVLWEPAVLPLSDVHSHVSPGDQVYDQVEIGGVLKGVLHVADKRLRLQQSQSLQLSHDRGHSVGASEH